ncbi:MAG: hypothetical protein EAZ85_10180 [Bacteroidetes bacterium]|nr:MAG: hypothetical protein EAZ85_10180 [Bacteroidota bacterium]TAG92070.1 MAG: hypothetical protein EAZ20_02850 [Bacteroidota bacterium]
MKNLILLFSHSLTDDQKEDAKQDWGVENFVALPSDLQQIFSNVPADLETINEYLQPIEKWLLENSQKDDFVLIQGDFGAVYYLVNIAKNNHLTPIYATTERKSVENMQSDGSIKTERIFKHKRFRKF